MSMREPKTVTEEEFRHRFAETDSQSWTHLLCACVDANGKRVPQSVENFWSSFQAAISSQEDGAFDREEDPDDFEAEAQWLRDVMAIFRLA